MLSVAHFGDTELAEQSGSNEGGAETACPPHPAISAVVVVIGVVLVMTIIRVTVSMVVVVVVVLTTRILGLLACCRISYDLCFWQQLFSRASSGPTQRAAQVAYSEAQTATARLLKSPCAVVVFLSVRSFSGSITSSV